VVVDVFRKLDGLRQKGRLRDGVVMTNGGICKIIAEESIKWPDHQELSAHTLTDKVLYNNNFLEDVTY
jgi:hypothetical protein